MLLGFNNVYRLVIETGIDSIMPDTDEFRAIQQRSFLVSVIAQEIANGCKINARSLRRWVCFTISAEVPCPDRINHPETKDMFAVLDDVQVGGFLLRKWELPERLVAVIENQQLLAYALPAQFPDDVRNELCVLGLAKTFAALLLHPEQVHHASLMNALLRSFWEFRTDLTPRSIERQIIPVLTKQKRCMPENIRMLLPDPA